MNVKNLWKSFWILCCVFMVLGVVNSFAQTVIVNDQPRELNALPNIPPFYEETLQGPPFPTPDYPSGMDFKDGELLMISEQAGTLYVINSEDGSLIRTVQLPGFPDGDPGSYGIASTDTFWWHSDYQRESLYQLDPTDGSVLAEFPMPVTYLGIAWDGNDLWGVSPNAAELYRIDTSNGNILETVYLSAVAGPIDITWDGTYLWVSERDGTNFHQIDVSGNILRTEVAPSGEPRGIATERPYIWVATNDYMLYRLELLDDMPSISGYVTDCQTGDPIESVVIIAIQRPTRIRTDTNMDGYYEISDLAPGVWWLIGFKGGYRFHVAKLVVEAGKSIQHDFCLEAR